MQNVRKLLAFSSSHSSVAIILLKWGKRCERRYLAESASSSGKGVSVEETCVKVKPELQKFKNKLVKDDLKATFWKIEGNVYSLEGTQLERLEAVLLHSKSNTDSIPSLFISLCNKKVGVSGVWDGYERVVRVRGGGGGVIGGWEGFEKVVRGVWEGCERGVRGV